VTLESDPISCAAPGVNNYVIEAKAENSCGATDLVTSNCSVTCKDVAKLSVLCQVSETEAKDGDLITVTGKATNQSTAVENITIQVLGPTGTVLCEQTFNGVAPGAEVSLPCQVTVECEPDQTISYKVVAVATNDCGQERKETSESCSVYCPPQGTNCPRTVGFWGQQCAQKTGGSTKFTKDEVTRIAACIDAESDAFSWSNSFDGFCAAINPSRPMDCKKQAHRQFAGLLANYCTGQLELIANNGNKISLDPSSPNPCKSSFPDAKNLGELIAAMDAKLAELDAMGADAQDHGYCMVSECADGINNGRGIKIDPACAEEYSSSRTSGGMELGTSGAGDNQVSAPALELYRPTPNPFTNSTTVAYAVGGNGQDVQIGIYDVAGRLVRTLASGFQAAGRYEVKWNGRSDNGTDVTHGVYFVRALVDGQRINEASRILYLR